MNQVLIIEDDASLVVGLSAALEADGHKVLAARDGPEGLRLALEQRPDLILLDLMLPGMSGFEICKRIRDGRLTCPVIMLTSRAEENDRVFGLELGADDYVTKPFSLRELLARVRAHLRRAEGVPEGEKSHPRQFRFGEIAVDFDRLEVRASGQRQPLTHREFRLLEYMIRHPGEVLSRMQLIEHVWDFAYDGGSNVVDVYVKYLREKIDRPFGIRSIETVRGAGYRLREDRPDASSH